MTDLRQAAQQALEFLESGNFVYPTKLAVDLRTALEQQQAEPVAWMELLREARDNCKASIVEEGISASRKEYRIDLEARLTAALEQPTCIGKDPRCPCPDGDACHYKDCGDTKAWQQAEPVAKLFGSLPVYDTTPPQRKELSEIQILDMMPSTIPADYDGPLMEFARAVEAKLKERNGY